MVTELQEGNTVSAAMHDMLHWLSFPQRVTCKLMSADTQVSARSGTRLPVALLHVTDLRSWPSSVTFSLGKQTAGTTVMHGQLWTALKVYHTLDIAPLRSESPPQKRSGTARVLTGFHSFTCTPTCSSAIGMSHTCLCLPNRSWYSFTDPKGMEGWVDLGAK